jgi:serine/threonine protein kinase
MYVVTRWYRAPEVILDEAKYDEGIDLWAVGCVFAELIGRQPILPGDTHMDQIYLIQKLMGKLSEEDLAPFGPDIRKYIID